MVKDAIGPCASTAAAAVDDVVFCVCVEVVVIAGVVVFDGTIVVGCTCTLEVAWLTVVLGNNVNPDPEASIPWGASNDGAE